MSPELRKTIVIPFPPEDREYKFGGKKQEIMKKIIEESRQGKFVNPEKLQELVGSDVLKQMAGQNLSRSMLSEIRSDFERRLTLLKFYGEDSIAHLHISSDTLNSLARLTEISEYNLMRITEVRRLLSKEGKVRVIEIRNDPVRPFYGVNPLTIKDLTTSLADFDSFSN